jgi:hypothetical protein
MKELRMAGAVLAPFLALISAVPAQADDFIVLTTPKYRTVVVADMTTIERRDGDLYVDIFVFPRSGSGADMLQSAAIVGCGRNVMNSQHTIYYDLTIAQGRVEGLRKIREEISDFDGNTGTMYGLDNTVYATLLPLCSGTPSGARWEKGDENAIVMKLAPEFVQ